DPSCALLRVLGHLRRTDPSVDPWYYDLPRDLVAATFPELPKPSGPPGPAVVEMPPHVVLDRWQRATADEMAALPLVISTPRSSFRLDFYRDLFPWADLRVLHLTRNPAASVNGLMDGWLHHGFFTAPVDRPLAIGGYSDVVPGGEDWWCYDIPPDWQDWCDRP